MEHFYQNIHGWFSAQHLYQQMVHETKSGGIFVEVGAWKGRSAAYMAVEIANSGKNIALHTVDWFKGSDEPAHHSDPDVRAGRLLEVFTKNIKPVRQYVTAHVMVSVAAAAQFEDDSLDFVFLDADHTYEGVKADILAWLPKVKPGGMLAGDDYNYFPGVKKAVDELLPAKEIARLPTWTWRKPVH